MRIKIAGLKVILVHRMEAPPLAGLLMAGSEAREAMVVKAVLEGVGVRAAGLLLVLKPMRRCTS